MDNELQKKKPEKKGTDSVRVMITFSSLALVLLVIAELYLMIVMSVTLPVIAVVCAGILVCTSLDLAAVMKWVRIKDMEQEEKYASILKSEKASYLLIRKYFDEIEEQITLMEEKISDPYQEIIAAQKATAKVTINRNKENTNALMNSNDKLLDIILGMENKIQEMSGIFSDYLEEDAKGADTYSAQRQAEISNQLREMELSMKNEILQAVNKLSSVSPQVVMASPQTMPMQQPIVPPISEESLGDLDLGGVEELADLAPLETDGDEPSLSPIPEEIEEPVAESGEFSFDLPEEPGLELEGTVDGLGPITGSELGPIPELSAEPELEPIPEPIAEPELEPIPELFAEPELGPILEPIAEPELEPIPEPVAEPEPMLGPIDELEPIGELGPIDEPEPVAEPMPEAAVQPAEKEVPPMPDLSDPNRAMSPDDINALLASMAAEGDGLNSELEPIGELGPIDEPESVAEPMPEAAAQPAEKEVPPMPDLSDPNRAMSPDDINALLASMAAEGDGLSSGLEPVGELGPIDEPEPAAEEVPPMPDMSDPNHAMSPDEIAALFANLG